MVGSSKWMLYASFGTLWAMLGHSVWEEIANKVFGKGVKKGRKCKVFDTKRVTATLLQKQLPIFMAYKPKWMSYAYLDFKWALLCLLVLEEITTNVIT